MKLLKRVPNRSRNSFDLSHRHLVTANFGELLPVTCLETVPGDYFEMSVADLIRAIPMVTSPFLRAKQHFDVWYVPYRDLWSNFEAFMTERSQEVHASQLPAKFCPYVTKGTLYQCIHDVLVNGRITTDVVGRPAAMGAYRIADLLGYGRNTNSEYKVNLFRLAAYNKIWYDCYRQQQYDDGLRGWSESDFFYGQKNPAILFNFDDVPCSHEGLADILNGTAVSSSEDQPIDRVASMLQMRYRLWKKDLFTGLMPATQFGDVSMITASKDGDLDISAIDNFYLSMDNTNNNNGRFMVTGKGADNEHLGFEGSIVDGNAYTHAAGLSANGSVSPIDTGGNSITAIGIKANNSAYNFTRGIFEIAEVPSGEYQKILTTGSDSFDPSSISQSISVLDLRKSEAIQIWREAALTAGNRISDNLRAHYGDDAEYNDHKPILLGSVSAPLNISDVNSTAQIGASVNQGLGDVAGKGISSLDDRVFKFKAHEFGVIMVMFSILPEAEYESYGIDRMNQLLEREDFFTPEYMDLGLEAVSSVDFYDRGPADGKIVGYAPRYIGYKQKLDKVFYGFRSTELFAPWASPKSDVTMVFSQGNGLIPLSVLYVNPALYNRNFSVGVDNSQQFICDLFFDVNAVRPMSLSGLPRL